MQQIKTRIKTVDNALPRGKPLPGGWCILLLPVDVYLSVLLGYFVLRLVSGWRLWPVALLSEFLHLLLIPAFGLLTVLLIARRWRRALWSGVLAILWLIGFGPLFLPRTSPDMDCSLPESTCTELTVMTYNVGYGLADPADLTLTLRTLNTDIVGLQEVSPEQARAVEDELGDLYPYRVFEGLPENGLAVLSRYPIAVTDYVPSMSEHQPAYLHTRLTLGDGDLSVFVFRIHPPRLGRYPVRRWLTGKSTYGYGYHTWRGAETIATVAEQHQPAILLADLNATDQSEAYHAVRRLGFVDAFRAQGRGFGLTFPARGDGWRNLPASPLLRIDYIFFFGSFKLVYASAIPDVASDHLPVMGGLAITIE